MGLVGTSAFMINDVSTHKRFQLLIKQSGRLLRTHSNVLFIRQIQHYQSIDRLLVFLPLALVEPQCFTHKTRMFTELVDRTNENCFELFF